MRSLMDAGAADAPAILAPGQHPLSFAGLRALIEDTRDALMQLGIDRGDRVAMVLPNGPEMAAGFIAIGCHTTVAPLNPAYRREEFDFYLADLKATALVLEGGAESPAADAAHRLGIRIIELTADNERPAGTYALTARGREPYGGTERAEHKTDPANFQDEHPRHVHMRTAATESPIPQFPKRFPPPLEATPGPDDIGLILHTSGTTSRPKIVPLTHRNICASAHNIAQTLRLGAHDRSLNIMPLFHIHGLMAGLLAPLGVGGSAFAAPGFHALRFFAWVEEADPTWYTAVPTMHQAILRRAKRNRSVIDNARLRVLRSASAPLPPQVLAELETTFKVPVIEAYAMTEAAHQMTSNPLPPGERIPGTVGTAAGPEVKIMDEQSNRLLAPGETGEVVIRGANVMQGYEANADANAKAFVGDWLRTGDQGMMDNRGYLTITGRLKEIINRGGEKISPREVDEALMDHPAIAQAVTFAIPHDGLGEEVAAAVVLRDGADAGRDEVRQFAAERLAAFKVPRHIVVVDAIPKGATGKLQRIGLAKTLGMT